MRFSKHLVAAVCALCLGHAGELGAEETGSSGPANTILPASYLGEAQASIYFAYEMGEMTPEASNLVSELAAAYARAPYREVILIGTADTAEADPDAISLARAEAVRAALMALGVEAFDISTEGWGTQAPTLRTGPGVREPLNRAVRVFFIR